MVQTFHIRLALQRLRFVLDSLYFLQTVHVRLHDLPVRLHHLGNVRLLHHRRKFFVLRLHSYQTVILIGLGMFGSSFSRFRLVDSIV